MNNELIDKVSELLREVAEEVLLAAFADGAKVMSWEKMPGEIVTQVDQLAEQRIAAGLQQLVPGSIVIGEEACFAQPALLEQLAAETAWVLDPLDGTRNFAAGSGPFAVMLSLLRHGSPVAAWILDPLAGAMVVAERGAGAWSGAERLRCRQHVTALGAATAIVSDAFAPPAREPWLASLRNELGEARPTQRCAGAEYPLLARGAVDLIVYWRTLPWDHVPGILLVEEAGGTVRQIDGTVYDPAGPKPGLVAAASEALLDAVLSLAA